MSIILTPKQINRRSFLKTSAAIGAAAAISAPNILRGHNLNEKLNIAMIGIGNRGQRNTGYFEKENIVGHFIAAVELSIVAHAVKRSLARRCSEGRLSETMEPSRRKGGSAFASRVES